MSIVDSDHDAGWERVRQQGCESPILTGNVHRTAPPTSHPSSNANPQPTTDSKTTASESPAHPAGQSELLSPPRLSSDDEIDSTPVADAARTEQPKAGGRCNDRPGELSISRRLVEKRRISERKQAKTVILYVVGYLLASIVLSWLIWQTYLAWY